MKAILVIDMPRNCAECPLLYDKDACYAMNKPTGLWLPLVCNGSTGEYGINKFPYEEKRVDWCPLKPMPKERKGGGSKDSAIAYGWNLLLEKIGGLEDEDTL